MSKERKDIIQELIRDTLGGDIEWFRTKDPTTLFSIDEDGNPVFSIFKHVGGRRFIHLDYHDQTGMTFAYGHDDLYDRADKLYSLVEGSLVTGDRGRELRQNFLDRQEEIAEERAQKQFEKYKEENNKPDLTFDEYNEIMLERMRTLAEGGETGFGSWSD